MKLRLIFILFLFSFFTTISAQRFNGGILAGINGTQIDGDNWGGYHKMGLNIGAFVNTDFIDNWGGQLEIKFSGKGSSTPYNFDERKAISLMYVDLPVLATYKIKEKLVIQAGISINYLFSAKYFDGDWFNDWDYAPNKTETSLAAGLNYALFQKIDINVRYNYSLMPVRSKSSTSPFGDGAWYNNVLSIAFYFNIGNNN